VHTSYPQQDLGQNHVIKYVIFQQRNVRIFAISGMNKDYFSITIYLQFISILCGPGRSDYGLDGPGSNPGGDQTGPGAHPASCTTGTGSFLEVEAARAWG